MLSWTTNKAKTLCWDPSDRVLGQLKYNMDTEKVAACLPDHCQHGRFEAEMARPGPSASHDLYKIYQVLFLHMSSWS